MAYPERLLHPNEEIVLDLHPHPVKFIPSLAALVLALGFGGFILVQDWTGILGTVLSVAAGVVLLGCVGWFAARVVEWWSTSFVVTTDRCIYRSGVLSKRGVEIPLDRINTVFFHQRLIERMFRAGDLTIESGGETGRQEFSDILNPEYVQTTIYHQIEDNENRKFDRVGRNLGGGGTGGSMAEELGRLADLRDRGVLSPEEFEAQKARLLES